MKSRLYSNYDELFGGVYWTELLGLLSLTIPLASVHLLKFLPAEISAAFGGRLSENELAATVLANTVCINQK